MAIQGREDFVIAVRMEQRSPRGTWREGIGPNTHTPKKKLTAVCACPNLAPLGVEKFLRPEESQCQIGMDR